MRKIIPALAAGATALAVAGGTLAYVNTQKDVTLSVDGAATTLTTRAGTVAEVLSERGISPGAHDLVAPAPAAEISDGTRIAVQFGRPVTVTVDGTPRSYWTTATTVGEALSALSIDAAGGKLSTSRSSTIGRQGLSIAVATQKSITVVAGGKQRPLHTTAQTVGAALTEAHVTVDRNDDVSAAASSKIKDGTKITVVRVDVRKATKRRSLGYDTIYRNTDSLAKGKTEIDREGRRGVKTIVYKEVRRDGKLTSRKKISSTITRSPKDRVVLVGTKRPAAKKSTAGSSGSTSRSSANRGAVSGNTVWDRLAKCESGGNWSINTGNGFYGGLQFTLSTWRANGGSGMPNHASRAQQISVAERVKATQGWGAWPACSAKLGLR